MVAVSSLPHSGVVVSRPRWLALIATALLFACNKEAPAVSEEPQAPSSPKQAGLETVTAAAMPAAAPETTTPEAPAPAAPEGAVAQAAARVSDTSFELALIPKGAYEVGKPGQVEVVLDAKPPYKVNDKYPYKFKAKEAAGLKFASLVVKDPVKLEPKRATLPVAFTPEKPGKHTVAGQFAFSVCTEDKCLIERRDLALDIDAK